MMTLQPFRIPAARERVKLAQNVLNTSPEDYRARVDLKKKRGRLRWLLSFARGAT